MNYLDFDSCISLLALLKQQGVDVKASTKNASINEEVPPLLEGGGKVEVKHRCNLIEVLIVLTEKFNECFMFQVWRINGSAKTRVPKEEIGKFYAGDCFIVLYTYNSGDKKEEYFLACWIGKESIQVTNMVCKFSKSIKDRNFQNKYIWKSFFYIAFSLMSANITTRNLFFFQ